MKKLMFITVVCGLLCVLSAGTATSDQTATPPETGRQIILHTPSVTVIQNFVSTIKDTFTEFLSEFTVEQTTAESSGDVYMICVGG